MSIYTFNDVMSITSCIFEDNHALVGGAVHIDLNNFFLTFESCLFSRNIASDSGGAIYLSKSNFFITFQNTEFEYNKATHSSGGAVYFLLSNAHLDFTDCLFHANIVENDNSVEENKKLVGSLGGGAVFSHTLNRLISFSRTVFDSNIARFSSGGACFFRTGHSDIAISSCRFVGNQAYDSGGAVNFMTFNTAVTLVDTEMTGNIAATAGGGAVFALAFNSLTATGTNMSSNQAPFGGALQFT